eukprot:2308444-Rhodomonas_salina.1
MMQQGSWARQAGRQEMREAERERESEGVRVGAQCARDIRRWREGGSRQDGQSHCGSFLVRDTRVWAAARGSARGGTQLGQQACEGAKGAIERWCCTELTRSPATTDSRNSVNGSVSSSGSLNADCGGQRHGRGQGRGEGEGEAREEVLLEGEYSAAGSRGRLVEAAEDVWWRQLLALDVRKTGSKCERCERSLRAHREAPACCQPAQKAQTHLSCVTDRALQMPVPVVATTSYCAECGRSS